MLSGLTTNFEVLQEDRNLSKKFDKKYKKVQEWTKIISGLSPLWMKNKMAYVVGKVYSRIWN